MNLQQAKEKLNMIKPNPYIHEGQLFTAIIVPKKDKERQKFIIELKSGKASTQNVDKYSSDGEYNIEGFMNIAFNL